MHIVADIGGTKMRVAASRDLSVFGTPAILDTPRGYADGIRAFADAARALVAGEKVESVAIGIKGLLSADKKSVMTSPQNVLRDWKDKPLAYDIAAALSAASVRLENDTALVGLGEAVSGAGKGKGIVVYITVSTGVNGVRIVDGVIDRGDAEIGGQYLQVGDALTSLEDLISGVAIAEKYGVHPKEIDKDSPLWEELARITAFGVHNAILHWSPERIVLGGSMFNEIGIPVERVHAHVAEILRKVPHVPEIVHSQLGDVGGLWGGVALLKGKN